MQTHDSKHRKWVRGSLPTAQDSPVLKRVLGFPRELRVFVNMSCNYSCSYGSGRLFCHSKKSVPGRKKLLNDPTSHHLFEAFASWGFRKLRICGMEPTLHPRLPSIIELARNCGFRIANMTTNGSHLAAILPELVDAGLSALTVSLHSLNPDIYQRITGGRLDKVLLALEAVRELEIPTKINCVVQRGVNSDIRPLLEYSWKRGFTPKIYQLLWQPSSDLDYNIYYVPLEEILAPVLSTMECVEVAEYELAMRTRYRCSSPEGNFLEFGTFRPKTESQLAGCRKCKYALKCEEGFLGYGYEVSPDLILNPCYLRPEASFSLSDYLLGDYDSLMQRLVHTNRTMGGSI